MFNYFTLKSSFERPKKISFKLLASQDWWSGTTFSLHFAQLFQNWILSSAISICSYEGFWFSYGKYSPRLSSLYKFYICFPRYNDQNYGMRRLGLARVAKWPLQTIYMKWKIAVVPRGLIVRLLFWKAVRVIGIFCIV